MESSIVDAIGTYGFPIMAAIGLGYFIYYIWVWVTQEVNPVIEESHMTLIDLIDKVRMLDNDLIRLNVKLDMLLQQMDKQDEKEIHITHISDDDYDDPADNGKG
jgi:hypothetical protein